MKNSILTLAATVLISSFLSAATLDNVVITEMDNMAEAHFVASLEYIETPIEDPFDLGFNVYDYLPVDFDPFKGMIYPLESIIYLEEEEELLF